MCLPPYISSIPPGMRPFQPYTAPEVSEVAKVLLTPEVPPWKQLTNRTLTARKRIALITRIFSDRDQIEVVKHLSGDDAQSFIDTIDEALDSLTPQIHGACLRYLYEICGRQALLPRSLILPLCYDQAEDPVCRGGRMDIWKGKYQGKDVAAQVLRRLPADDSGSIRRRFCSEAMAWRALRHENVVPLIGVTMADNKFVMVSEWMAKGDIMKFTKEGTNVDRLGLLEDVTKGLIYMHDQGMIHGDLKGANILIDGNGRARLTGFGLITTTSERSTVTPPATGDGAIPWMSPELLHPKMFGLEECRPTEESDCYALGMVIYEVLSGQAPFASHKDPEVIFKVLRGERPSRPEGDEGKLFTDGIWEVLGRCWKPQPCDRLSAKDILLGLEGNPLPPIPLFEDEGDMGSDIDAWSDAADSEIGLPTTCSDNRPLGSRQTGNRLQALRTSSRKKLKPTSRRSHNL